jgi:hypothetical protein
MTISNSPLRIQTAPKTTNKTEVPVLIYFIESQEMSFDPTSTATPVKTMKAKIISVKTRIGSD